MICKIRSNQHTSFKNYAQKIKWAYFANQFYKMICKIRSNQYTAFENLKKELEITPNYLYSIPNLKERNNERIFERNFQTNTLRLKITLKNTLIAKWV
jgi:hypothetical protein